MPIYEGTIGGVRFCVEAFEVTTNENAVGAQGRAMFGIVRGELLENAPYIKVGGFASDANAFGELEHEDTIEFDVTLKVRGAPAAGTLEVGLIQNVLATKRDANYGDQRVFKTDEGSVLLDCVPAREPWFASKPKSLDASVVSDAQESTVE